MVPTAYARPGSFLGGEPVLPASERHASCCLFPLSVRCSIYPIEYWMGLGRSSRSPARRYRT